MNLQNSDVTCEDAKSYLARKDLFQVFEVRSIFYHECKVRCKHKNGLPLTAGVLCLVNSMHVILLSHALPGAHQDEKGEERVQGIRPS